MSHVSLHCGDCLEIVPTLDIQIDAVLTDPPWGVNLDAAYRDRFTRKLAPGKLNPGNYSTGAHRRIHGDDKPFDPAPWLGYRKVILWGYQHFAQRLPPGTILIWQKKLDRELGTFLSDGELAWKKGGSSLYIFEHRWNGFLRASERGQKTLHPTQKPIALMRWCIERLKLPEGATILDPYMGSGPVGVAAVQMGYNYIGIEIVPEYHEIAAARIDVALHEPQQMELGIAEIRDTGER
ncbi:hypothetical protein ES703_67470 [subsurface metagenome]